MTMARIILWLLALALTVMAETRVRVTGMSGMSESQILEMMGGRLAHVRASAASAPLADDAAFILRQILIKDGYANAAVDWKINGRDEIVLVVIDGGRQSLGVVTVNGVPADEAGKLARIFAKPAQKDHPLGAGAPPFREGDVATGLAYLCQEFNARGYWNAGASISSRSNNNATGAVDLTIDARPGPMFQIGAPVVSCSDAGEADLARQTARPFTGLRATSGNLNTLRAAVEEAAVRRGYPDARIRMAKSLESGIFIPVFTIDLGKRVKLRHIHIEGLKRTSPGRIAARLKKLTGGWYDEAAMNKRLREFLATGAFSSARVETTEVGNGTIDATLHFDEARAREVNLSAGYGTYQGIITRASYADRNLFGHLLGFSAGCELSTRGLLGEVRLTDPWLFGSDVSTTARVYALAYTREGYSTFETGLEDRFVWKAGKHYSLELLAGYSLVNANEDGLPLSALGETVYTHPRLRLSQTLDYRDNPVLPTSGWHLENSLQAGAAIGDLSTSYVMAGVAGGWYHEINRNYQMGIGGECTVLKPSGDGGDLPIDLRLFNGGARSVRSFPERGMGPLIKDYPTGGEAMWNLNAELFRKLGDSVKAVAFFDAGSLAEKAEQLAASEVDLAVGLGIRFDLPIGPIRLEYGYNLTRDPGEPAGAFHFAIGWAY